MTTHAVDRGSALIRPEKVLRRILVERAWGDVDKAALLTMEEPALLGEGAAQLERKASAAERGARSTSGTGTLSRGSATTSRRRATPARRAT